MNSAASATGSPRRIALVLWNGDVGGAEVLTASLAKHMRLQGVDASVVFVGRGEPLATRLRDSAVPYRALGFPRGRDVLRHPGVYAAAVARAGRDGAVLVEGGFMGAALRAGGYGATIVAAEHGAILELPGYGWRRRASWWLSRLGGAWADDVEVAVSDFVLRRTLHHPHAARVLCIYNGIDTQRFCRAEPIERPRAQDGVCVVGFAGRLIHGKGHDHLIRALACARSSRPMHVRIAGDGPQRARLQALARSLHIEDRVEFVGLTHDMPAFWHSVDLAVVPSAEFTEACPMTPLEAMAAGKPVVATRNGGLPEIVLDGVTGQLVGPGDPPALAAALVRYAEDERLSARHGAAGRTRIEQCFDIGRCARSYLQLLGGEAGPGVSANVSAAARQATGSLG